MVSKRGLEADKSAAQKKKDQVALDTLRLVLSAVKNAEIDVGGDLSEEQITKVLQKEAKQRVESIESFREGGRDELADKEAAELAVIEKYLPKPLDDAELEQVIDEVFEEVKPSDMGDMGKVMGAANAKLAGRADGGRVAQKVKEKLAQL